MTTEPRNAGIVSRMISALIDVAVVFGLQVVIFVAVILVRLTLDVSAFLDDDAWIWGSSTFFGVSLVYLTIAWAAFGRTIGQMLMGLGVISRRSGRKPRFVVALGRAALCIVFPIGLAWVVFSRRRWSVQDMACYTRVVYTHEVLRAPSLA